MDDLYAAYGSNLSRVQMQQRCPGAAVAAAVALPGWRLAVRKYALVEADPTAACPVGLWRVTPAHLTALDRYEGPHAYARRRVPLPDGREAWIYLELVHRPGPPSAAYAARLRQGYADFGFDLAVLEAALARGG